MFPTEESITEYDDIVYAMYDEDTKYDNMTEISYDELRLILLSLSSFLLTTF